MTVIANTAVLAILMKGQSNEQHNQKHNRLHQWRQNNHYRI